MNKVYKAGIKDLPFVLLFIDLIWWLASLLEINILSHWWIPEIASHSLASVSVMAFYAYVHRYCLYSWICIAGLGLLNVTNLLHFFFNFTYVQLYAGVIITTCLTFAVVKWRQLYYR